MIGKTNSLTGMKQQMEMVNISLTSNQTLQEDLVGAIITLSYGEYNEDIVWDGKEVTRSVPAYIDYTISFGSIADYKAPEPISYTAVKDNSRSVVATYYTEIVSVTMESDDGSSVIGAKVNINGINHIWNGTALTQKVAFGTSYTVEAGNMNGFITPDSQTYTASQSSRNLSFVYIASNLTVNILSNQGTDSTISSVKATVTYGSTSVEVSNGEALSIPSGVSGMVTFPEVEGYLTPEPVSFTHTNNVTEITGEYKCEILTVNVSSDEGVLSGYEVTISKEQTIGTNSKYIELEYIEATGTQWVDTGFTPNNNSRMVLDFESTKSGATNNIIGTRSNTSSKVFTFSTVNGYWRVGYNNASTQTSTEEDMLRHVLDFDKNYISLDGTQLLSPTSATFNGYSSIYIGAIHATSKYVGYVKIYDCKIYDNGTLVRDFTPALREDGIAGLYDSINDVFYASAGTSNFVAGPEATYERIEYIKSTGTQYINTGFKPNQDTRVVIDCIITKASVDEISGVISAIDSNNKAFGFSYDPGLNAIEGRCILHYNTSRKETYDNYESLHTRYIFDINKNKLLRNGVELCSENPTSFQCDEPLYLSVLNNKGVTSSGNTTSLELYSCQIYDNDVLVRDYIPVLRSDGTAGLYDNVNKRFYSSGSGINFVAGGETTPMYTQTSVTGTYKIPFGTSYTIEANTVNGYKTPASISRIAKDKSYLATMEYKIDKIIDLSMYDTYGNPIQQSTANCYVVREPGRYKFPLVYGNAIKNGQVNYAAFTNNGGEYSHDFVNSIGEVITQPYIFPGGGNTVSVVNSDCDSNIISDLLLDRQNAYISFTINQVPQEGGNIILQLKGNTNGGYEDWSWHIWLWPHDLTPVTITNATGVEYNIMPVNLATKLDNADSINDTTGWKNWFYQWGRPTPLLCPLTYDSDLDHPNYGALNFTIAEGAETLNLGLQNPTTFYTAVTSSNNCWFGKDSTKTYNLWDAACTSVGCSDNDVVKTVYDPSPVGFKMPNGNTFTGFSTDNIVESFPNGLKFKRNSSDTTGVFFPASGNRDTTNGLIYNTGEWGNVWSAAVGSFDYAHYLFFWGDDIVSPNEYGPIAEGYSVRPVEDN